MSQASAIAAATPGAAKPCQFEHVANSGAHYSGTGPELWRQCGGRLDGFVCAAGSGGTVGGVSRYLKEVHPGVACHLIDPTGSGLKCFVEDGVFASSGACFIDGIGIGRLTANFATARMCVDVRTRAAAFLPLPRARAPACSWAHRAPVRTPPP